MQTLSSYFHVSIPQTEIAISIGGYCGGDSHLKITVLFTCFVMHVQASRDVYGYTHKDTVTHTGTQTNTLKFSTI